MWFICLQVSENPHANVALKERSGAKSTFVWKQVMVAMQKWLNTLFREWTREEWVLWYGTNHIWNHVYLTLRTSCEDFPELTQNTSGPAMLTMYLRWCVSPTWKISILLKFCSKFCGKITIFYRLPSHWWWFIKNRTGQ